MLANQQNVKDRGHDQRPVSRAKSYDSDGILRHGEHLADLILAVGPRSLRRLTAAYCSLARGLLDSAVCGRLAECNEKIDGSPAIVLGFDSRERPFLGYSKGALAARGAQRLLRDAQDLERHYPPAAGGSRAGLYQVFSKCVEHLLPAMAALPRRDLLLQGDLLFVSGDDRRVVTPDTVVFRANPSGIEYKISRGDPLFEKACAAEVALVLHTSSHRKVDNESGRIAASGRAERDQVIHAAQAIEQAGAGRLLVLTPYRAMVELAAPQTVSVSELRARFRAVREDIATVRKLPQLLSGEFLQNWPRFEPLVRIFFNRSLKDRRRGGIYRAARDNEPFDYDRAAAGFAEFLSQRAQCDVEAGTLQRVRRAGILSGRTATAEEFSQLRSIYQEQLKALWQAYYCANRLQAALSPFLRPQSVIGGGAIEGLMLESARHRVVVKLVDRMEYTIRNNRGRWGRGAPIARALDDLPAPFNRALPAGTAIFPIGGQPFHHGHIDLIRSVAATRAEHKLVVVASTLAPCHTAVKLSETKLASTVAKIRQGEYEQPFSVELRRELLQAARLPSNVDVVFIPVGTIWAYFGLMRDRAPAEWIPGKYKFVIGEKELAARRYGEQFVALQQLIEPLAVPALHCGISGTAVRRAIKALAHNRRCIASRSIVDTALDFIEDHTLRASFIDRLTAEWAAADRLRERLEAPGRRRAKS